MELTKEVLKFIYQSETEDALLLLEGYLDFTLSSRSVIISVYLKAKEATIKAVKDIIAAHGLEGLDAKETIKKINKEIKSLIFSKKVIHSGNTTEPLPPNPPPSGDTSEPPPPPPADEPNPFEHIENNPHLSLTEKECLLSVFDPAYKTTTIADLPDKARRHYFRLAGAKLRMLKMLDVAI